MEKTTVRVPSNMSGPAFTADGRMNDGLVNFVSRLGTGADKSSHYQYLMDMFGGHDMDAAYRTSVFKNVVDIPPEDMVRAWRTFAGADDEQITAITREERRLRLRQKVREALILARKDGASAILIGTGGNAATPLDPTKVAKDGLKFITVMTRNDISPQDRETDPENPNFNEPKMWRLANGSATEVHPSRVIKFVGNPIRVQGYWDGWNGESLWVAMRRAIINNDQIAGGIAAMIDEAKLDVMKIKNFMANIITEHGESNLVKRFGAMGSLKSITNAVIMDADDEYEQKTLTFQGLTDVQTVAMTIVGGLAKIPSTRMWGRSPQGMNATGESDMRNYYDLIKSGQENDLGPTIEPLDECLLWSALGSRPEKIFYEWNPLYQLSEKEAAEVEKIYAETATSYANSGLLPDTALTQITQSGMIERGQWPGAEKAFAEAKAAGDEPGLTAEPTESELAEEEARTALAVATASDPFTPTRKMAANDARFMDATPRTLYVRRDVLNWTEIKKWAKSQGLTGLVDGPHVTIVSSATPIDWMKMGDSWQSKLEMPEGGPRIVDRLGNFVVLLIASSELNWRHQAAKDAGASWDFPEYQPHISLVKNSDIDVTKIEPYRGKIVLGPEIFEERKLY